MLATIDIEHARKARDVVSRLEEYGVEAPAHAPAPPRAPRFRRAILSTLGGMGGVVVLAAIGLAVWDGGANLDPQRELLPGVALDLRTAETGRGAIEYDLHGSDGPVILSVHAGLGGADQGRLFASWLQEDGYRILSPSRPGYLGTPLSSGRTVDEQADLLAALLDELDIDQVGVFAVSAGSPVAYTLAARHPDRVWGLISVGGVSLPEPDASVNSAVQSAFMNAIGQKLAKLTAMISIETIVSVTLDETSTFTGEQKAERVDYIVHTENVRLFFETLFDSSFPYERRMPGTDNDMLQTRDLDVALERITAPALIVHGTHDGDVLFEHGETAAARITGTLHHWMPDDDHLGFWLSPQSADAQHAVRTFLDDHAPSS